MSAYYFAYGSNMNPARMKARGMMVADMQPGTLQGMRLAFNKRAAKGIPQLRILWGIA